MYFLYKNVMLQIDPLKSSCSQKQQYPEGNLSLKVLRKNSFLENVAVLKVTLQVQLFTTALLKFVKLTNCQINRKYLFQKSPLQVEISTIARLNDLLYLTLRHRTVF